MNIRLSENNGVELTLAKKRVNHRFISFWSSVFILISLVTYDKKLIDSKISFSIAILISHLICIAIMVIISKILHKLSYPDKAIFLGDELKVEIGLITLRIKAIAININDKLNENIVNSLRLDFNTVNPCILSVSTYSKTFEFVMDKEELKKLNNNV